MTADKQLGPARSGRWKLPCLRLGVKGNELASACGRLWLGVRTTWRRPALGRRRAQLYYGAGSDS
jgi:hypothetical protein